MLHDTTLKRGNPSLRACHLRCSQFDLGEVVFGSRDPGLFGSDDKVGFGGYKVKLRSLTGTAN